MGFLARRTPHPPATAPTAQPLQGPAQGARIRWRRDEPVGWDRLPEPARLALAAAGHTTGPMLAAGTYAATPRRDSSGRYWHDTDAWWISPTVLLTVRAREALTPTDAATSTDTPQLRRTGTGLVLVSTHPLTGPGPITQRWARPPHTTPAPPATSGGTDVQLTDHAVDVLPRAVREDLGPPTGQCAIRHYPAHGGCRDQIHAYRRVSAGELVALTAVREAGAYPDPDTEIDAADWHITTHRAHVGTVTQTDLPW